MGNAKCVQTEFVQQLFFKESEKTINDQYGSYKSRCNTNMANWGNAHTIQCKQLIIKKYVFMLIYENLQVTSNSRIQVMVIWS